MDLGSLFTDWGPCMMPACSAIAYSQLAQVNAQWQKAEDRHPAQDGAFVAREHNATTKREVRKRTATFKPNLSPRLVFRTPGLREQGPVLEIPQARLSPVVSCSLTRIGASGVGADTFPCVGALSKTTVLPQSLSMASVGRIRSCTSS